MKKWIVAVVIVVAALAIVAGGAAFAAYQASDQRASVGPLGGALGPMMRGPWVGEGFGLGPGWDVAGQGELHDAVLGALAEGLGLSQDDLTARLQAGETLGSIAEAQGLSDDQLQTLWESAWQDAVDSAVANGTLTQAQADRILQHVRSAGAALGCPMTGGAWARGWGRGMERGFFDRPGTP